MSANVKIHLDQGGAALGIDSGGTLNVAGALQVNGVAVPHTATFAISTGAANVANIDITVKAADGSAVTTPASVDVYVSDSAAGVGLTAASASTGPAIAGGGAGAIVGTLTAKKAFRVQTDATGRINLINTDTGKNLVYFAVVVDGVISVSRQLVVGDFG